MIIHFRSADHTRNLIADLLAHCEHHLLEILVVENGGTPADRSIVDKRIRYITLPENAGYAGACNTGARHATGQFLLFLNDDLSFTNDWLRPLLEQCEADPSIGMIAPGLTYKNERFQLSWGVDPTLLEEYRERRRQREARRGTGRAYRHREQQSTMAREVDWITGAVMLCSRSAFEHVCGFDESFPFYYEDVDICRRVRVAGYHIRYDPSVSVTHFLGGSSDIQRPQTRALYQYGKVRYYARHCGYISFLLLKLYLSIASIRHAFRTQVEENSASPARFDWRSVPFRPSGPRCDSRPT